MKMSETVDVKGCPQQKKEQERQNIRKASIWNPPKQMLKELTKFSPSLAAPSGLHLCGFQKFFYFVSSIALKW